MGAGAWLIGAVLAASGSIASNLGVNMQKYSFILNNQLPKEQQKLKTRQPKWLVGMCLVIAGSLGDFAALALAPQSIVAPIGAITLVANVFFAHFWLKESLSYIELAGTGLIVTGCIITVAFAEHDAPNYDIHAIGRFFYSTTFIVYAILSLVLVALLYRFQKPITPMKQKIVDATRRYELAYDAGNQADMDTEDFFISSLQSQYKKHKTLHPFSLCALSGIFGGQSVLFGKMVGELISTTFAGNNQFFSPFLYLFVLCMLLCVMGQLHYLAIALNFFDALYVVPVFQCFFIGFSTLGGAAFFGEFSSFDVLQSVFFPLGFLTLLSGVLVLSQRKMNDAALKRKLMSDNIESSAMESIEEGDEDAVSDDYEEEDSSQPLTDEQARMRQVKILERKRRRGRRVRSERLKKLGYEGLSDAEEDDDEDLLSDEDEEFLISDDEQQDEDYSINISGATGSLTNLAVVSHDVDVERFPSRKTSDESKGSNSLRSSPLPSAFYQPRQTPRSRGRRASSASSPTTPGDLSPGMSPSADSGSVPSTPSGRPRSIDRRASMARGTRIPPALILDASESEQIASGPSTPSAPLASIFRAISHAPGIVAPGASQPFVQASEDEPPSFLHPSVNAYDPPSAPVQMFSTDSTIDEKVKKYSSLPYHASGLVGMPLAAALGHLITVVKEDTKRVREEHERSASITVNPLHESTEIVEPMIVNEHTIHMPVAEPVMGLRASSAPTPTGDDSHPTLPIRMQQSVPDEQKLAVESHDEPVSTITMIGDDGEESADAHAVDDVSSELGSTEAVASSPSADLELP